MSFEPSFLPHSRNERKRTHSQMTNTASAWNHGPFQSAFSDRFGHAYSPVNLSQSTGTSSSSSASAPDMTLPSRPSSDYYPHQPSLVGREPQRPRTTVDYPSRLSNQSAQNTVIDLTADDRSDLPTFPSLPSLISLENPARSHLGHRQHLTPRIRAPALNTNNAPREVIALSDDDEGESSGRSAPSSPEVQFVSSRARSRSLNPHDAPPVVRPAPLEPDVGRPAFLSSMTEDTMLLAANLMRVRPVIQGLRSFTANFIQPQLDHSRAGFDYQNPARRSRHGGHARTPTYEAPTAPRAGFTRSVRPENSLVCIKCDRELGTGETEPEQQVWVIKACGHVYCGKCAREYKQCHPKKKSMPSQAHAGDLFDRCLVEGCGKQPRGKTNFFQVYL